MRGSATAQAPISIDPYGRITERVPLFTPGTIDGRIVPMNVGTPYKLWLQRPLRGDGLRVQRQVEHRQQVDDDCGGTVSRPSVAGER